jgi:hypothetical protein
MVRKIGGDKPTHSVTPGVQATRTVESTKVGNVEQVKAADRQATVGGVRRSTRLLTPEQQQELLAMVDEEADKMFTEQGLPESKKETVKGAVKMAIEASITEEDK